jgi:hypothetical protein
MNTQGEMDRIITDWLDDRVVEPPLEGLREALDRTQATPQDRRRFLRWPDASTQPGQGRTRRMLSTTGAITAIAIAAIALNLNTTPADPPALGSGDTHVVAVDGSGDFDSVGAAIEVAAAGDTVAIRPGTYTVGAVIDKDIRLVGDGDRAAIVLVGSEDPLAAPAGNLCGDPDARPVGCSLVIREASPEISGLTFQGDSAGIEIIGGSPVLQYLSFDRVGPPYTSYVERSGSPIAITGGSTADIVMSEFDASGSLYVTEGSEPTIEGNDLRNGPALLLGEAGPATRISSNHFMDTEHDAIVLLEAAPVLIEGNTFERTDATAVAFSVAGGEGPTIRGNRFVDIPGQALVIPRGTSAVIEGNEFSGNGTSIALASSEVEVTDNIVRGGKTGIAAVMGASPRIIGNVIDVDGRGITVDARSAPIIEGNTVCGEISSIYVAPGATLTLGENRVCDVPEG